jgi:polysaccharide biosynthesis protein PslG
VVRRRFISCIFLGGLLLLGAALSSSSGEATTTGGRPSAFFGIAPQTTLHRNDLSLMRRTGIGSLRFPIYWSQSEPAPGVFDWRATDAFLISTSRYGFERLPFIWGSPPWVTSTRRVRHCRFSAARCSALQMPVHSLAQRRAWSEFLQALVGRYGPTGTFWELHPELPRRPIRAWQIWNEENDHRFAEASVPDYVALLRGSAPAIRSVDPDARILLGGLYGTPRIEPALDATTFLSRLYGHNGIKGLFDGVALHPYAFNPRLMAAGITALRAVMRRHGDGHGDLFITEFGWGSQTRAAGGDAFENGPAMQADYLKRAWAILLANRRRWHLRTAYWFTWQDIPAATTRCDFCDSTGLLGLDGLPKRALRRFAQVAHR